MSAPNADPNTIHMKSFISDINKTKMEQNLTPMDALDLVKERYAANFEKVKREDSNEEYYYILLTADYYLVYEETIDDKYYLIHLYEFVLDEPDTGMGHTVTYGWYKVDKENGSIVEKTY